MTNQEMIEALKNTGDFMVREQGITPPETLGLAIEHIEKLDTLLSLMINMDIRPGFVKNKLRGEARKFVEKRHVEASFVS